MKELRFPAAACSVSSEELEQLSLSLSTSLSALLSAVFPVLAINLLCQLLEVRLDFAWFSGSRSSPLISPQMVSFAVTVKMAHC